MENKEERKRQLAVKVLEACRNQLFFEHRFLEQALFRLKIEESEEVSFGTDGMHLFFQDDWVLQCYMEDMARVTQSYLHTVLHCLYQHPFFAEAEKRAYWDLAADISVESILQKFDADPQNDPDSQEEILRRKMVDRIEAECGVVSVRKIFVYLQQNVSGGQTWEEMELAELGRLFRRDTHDLWYEEETGEDSVQQEQGSARGKGKTEADLQQKWKDIAEHVLMDMQTFQSAALGKDPGDLAGSMMRRLQLITRENYDYSAFLRKFACLEEKMQTNDEEFDYIFYTYGLRLYGKIPLIEPLEYKETYLIHEFIIAIDTSGSCEERLVEKFLTKTCNILQQTESFTTKVNIHVLQCDCKLQDDVKMESLGELEQYTERLTLKGFGGTDFRPVFEHVDEMLAKGEMRKVDGLIYFTDGYGIFPCKPPGYKTAFVFLDKEESVKVPAWAMKVYLDKEISG